MIEVLQGDCREILPTLAADSVDACVTDPPYHLTAGKKGGTGPASVNLESPYGRARITTGFMGKEWDGGDVAMRYETWAAVLRTLKPGAHLLAFGGTRTHHRMMCAVEDAGFEIRDVIMWVFGSGFPKSLNLDGQWSGWGTALKPAYEPIIVARKPLAGTVAANVQRYGTGAINVDGCRVPGNKPFMRAIDSDKRRNPILQTRSATGAREVTTIGRWPANLIHDGSEEVVRLFPNVTGATSRTNTVSKGMFHGGDAGTVYDDGGEVSAVRFFYCAKASREDREEWCDALPVKLAGEATGGRKEGSVGLDNPRAGASRGTGARNHHPTVKPHDLMRYLCRLVTPPGGLILDPFAGSGSTAKAALAEGFRSINIERDPEYAEIIRRRARGQAGLAL